MEAYHLPAQLTLNQDGRVQTRGILLADLAKQYGTPLYVMDEQLIQQHCRDYWQGLSGYENAQVVYAGKALLTLGICRIIEEQDCWLDVVSGGELYTAIQAGFPVNRIIFHGNNKSEDELRMAIEHHVARIVLDNTLELQRLEALAKKYSYTVPVMIRVTPGVEAHTHEYIRTAQTDSKFGLGIYDEELQQAIRNVQKSEWLILTGFHCHIGSQIMEEEPFHLAVDLMFALMNQVRKEYGLTVKELNLGGGIGARYTQQDRPMNTTETIARIGEQVSKCAKQYDFPLPKLYIEPGRSIMAEAGITLYEIGAIKQIPGIRTYVSIDGGMSDNPRPSLYQAVYEAIVVDKANQEPTMVVHLAGKHCETGDILIKDLRIPPVEPGDILAVFSTGAYNYSMASNYNRVPRPAMILISSHGSDLLQERESYQDLIRFDRIPLHLQKPQKSKEGSSCLV